MGKFDTHGGYFAPQNYYRINEGGSHEENPNGGVQVGTDENGIPNAVEQDETVYDDFVFSDRVVISDDMISQFKLNPWAEGLTYAEYVDKLVEETEERPLDPTSNNGLRAMLSRAASAQEQQKQNEEKQQLEQELAQLSPEELQQLEAMLAEQEASQQMPQQASPEMMQEMPEETMMAPEQMAGQMPMSFGGPLLHSYAQGGDTDDNPVPGMDGKKLIRVDNGDGTFTFVEENPAVDTTEERPRSIQRPILLDNSYASADNTSVRPSLYDPFKAGSAEGSPQSETDYSALWGLVPFVGPIRDMINDGVDWSDVGSLALDVLSLVPGAYFAKAPSVILNAADKANDMRRVAKVAGAVNNSKRVGRAIQEIGESNFDKAASKSFAERLGLPTGVDVDAAVRRNTSTVAGSAAETWAKTKSSAISQLDDEAAVLKEKLSDATRKLTDAKSRSAGQMEIDGLRREAESLERKIKENAQQADYLGKKTAAPEPQSVVSKPEPVAEMPVSTPVPSASPSATEPVPSTAPATTAPTLRRTPWQKVKRGVGALADITFNPVGITNELGRIPAKGLRGWKYPIGAAELTGRTLGAIGYYWSKNHPEARALREYMNTPIFDTDIKNQFDGDSTSVIWNSDNQEPSAGDFFFAKGGKMNLAGLGDDFDPNRKFNGIKVPSLFEETKPSWYPKFTFNIGPMPETRDSIAYKASHGITPEFRGIQFDRDPNFILPPVSSTEADNTAESEASAMYPTWPRYTSAITSGLTGLYDVFQRPDKLRVPTQYPALASARMHLRDLVFNPVDQNMMVQDTLNAGAGMASQIRNAGLGPSTGRTLLALDSNIGKNIGTARVQGAAANESLMNNVLTQNNQNAGTLGQFQYGISRDNASLMNQVMQQRIQNELFRQRYNNEAESAKYAAIQNQLDTLAQALSGIGRENFAMNQINSNPYYPYLVSPNGGNVYAPKGKKKGNKGE